MISWAIITTLLLASSPVPGTQPDPVILQLEQELREQPERLDLWLSLSWRHEQAGSLDAALAAAHKALAVADVYDTRLRLGWLLLSSGRCPDALAHYRAASLHAAEAEDPLLGQQACLVKQEDYLAAIEAGERLLELNPNNLWGMKRQAYALYMIERFKLAEQRYQRVLSVTQDDPEMNLGLGLCHVRLGKLDAGRAQCALAAEKLKDDPRVTACLESAEAPGVIVAGSLHSGTLSYSGQTTQESLTSLSLAAALIFPSGVELTAGLMLVLASATDATEDYLQSNPILSLAYTDDVWRLKGVFTYLVADDGAVRNTPVISAMIGHMGAGVDFDLEINTSWYGRTMALQAAPGLRWHLPGQVDLLVGGEVIGLWERVSPGAFGPGRSSWTWYASGRLGLGWQVFEHWSLHAGAFYGLRRFAVDDGGWSVWNNDDRFFTGYQVGSLVNLSRHWALFLEFRQLFGDQQDGLDADFMLLGGILGLRAWY